MTYAGVQPGLENRWSVKAWGSRPPLSAIKNIRVQGKSNPLALGARDSRSVTCHSESYIIIRFHVAQDVSIFLGRETRKLLMGLRSSRRKNFKIWNCDRKVMCLFAKQSRGQTQVGSVPTSSSIMPEKQDCITSMQKVQILVRAPFYLYTINSKQNLVYRLSYKGTWFESTIGIQKHAGVAQWQSSRFPTFRCGFDTVARSKICDSSSTVEHLVANQEVEDSISFYRSKYNNIV